MKTVFFHEFHHGVLQQHKLALKNYTQLRLCATYPTFTLMAHSPPVNRSARNTLLIPRPLHGHISAAHQPLAYVVEAMGDMVVWEFDKIPFALGFDAVLCDVENFVQISADILEAMQLVEY